MTEKGDIPSDSVSLPPNYAPSEAYTESPPPAYKNSGMAAVRVARIICFTLLSMTFIIGFFVVTHKLVQTRKCDCSEAESNRVEHAALLAQIPNLPNSDLNNNRIEEDIEKKEASLLLPKETHTKEKEEEFVPQEQAVEGANAKESPMSEREKIQEEVKKINLPKDLLLGNPKLAGHNVHCKVEKRQQKIADGIMTQAIIVTCDDEDDSDKDESEDESDENLPMPIGQIKPPLSLLSTIMKVLSARPRSNENDRPMSEPQMIPFPIRQINGPFPVMHSMRGPFPVPLSGPMNPALNFVPLRKIEVRRPFPMMEENESMSIHPFNQRPPPPMMEEARSPRMNAMFPPRSFMHQPEENNVQIRRIPFPLPAGPLPIRMIRLPSRRNDVNEESSGPESREMEREDGGPFPFHLHPLMNLLPARRRIIRIRPNQSGDDNQIESLPFPLPRGALPLRPSSDEPIMSHPMPEASGRALPSPVALPGVRVVRLPFRPQPQLFPEAKVITHMEVRQHPEEVNQQRETQSNLQPPKVPENKTFRPNNKEFGPPKTHTVIENAPRSPFEIEEPETDRSSDEPFHQEPITQTQSQLRFLAPPPPKFAREGRTSFLAQLNPDAEVIPTNLEDRSEDSETTIHRLVLN